MIQKKTKNGFTLIEILVAVGIFAILATIASVIFFMVIRGRAKALATKELREAGSNAILSIEDYLRRFAKSPQDCGSQLVITGLDEQLTTFKCDSGKIASNSAILTPATVRCSNFQWSCEPSGFGFSRVTISFDLEIGTEASSELKSALGIQKQSFSTQIFLRGQKL